MANVRKTADDYLRLSSDEAYHTLRYLNMARGADDSAKANYLKLAQETSNRLQKRIDQAIVEVELENY